MFYLQKIFLFGLQIYFPIAAREKVIQKHLSVTTIHSLITGKRYEKQIYLSITMSFYIQKNLSVTLSLTFTAAVCDTQLEY